MGEYGVLCLWLIERRWRAARRIRLKNNCPSTKLLLHQLQEFPIADQDDGPDALEMAVRLATELLSNNQRNDGLGNRLPIG